MLLVNSLVAPFAVFLRKKFASTGNRKDKLLTISIKICPEIVCPKMRF